MKGHSKKTAKPDYPKSNFADEYYFSIAETAEYIYCYVNNDLSYFLVRSEMIKVNISHLSPACHACGMVNRSASLSFHI
ncbi:MAG: hypothetical protein BGP14_11895 [Sphingobacteriales bacterium 44-15]|nr:MAG: hypothetical protein BGP14_11895 [Sphingobacteriales bacterium 44-15]